MSELDNDIWAKDVRRIGEQLLMTVGSNTKIDKSVIDRAKDKIEHAILACEGAALPCAHTNSRAITQFGSEGFKCMDCGYFWPNRI